MTGLMDPEDMFREHPDLLDMETADLDAEFVLLTELDTDS